MRVSKAPRTKPKPATIKHHNKGKLAKTDDGTPPLLVDDRAGSRELMKYPPICRVGELRRLSSGDVAFTGRLQKKEILVGVEVKSINDLVSSIATGRLQASQIPEMFKSYHDVWLVYYGEYCSGPVNGELLIGHGQQTFILGKREVPFGWLENMLFTLTLAGVHVKWVGGDSKDEGQRRVAYWVGGLARWYQKRDHHGFRAFDHSQRPSASPNAVDPVTLRMAHLANCLPGLGYDRAMAVAHHFLSAEDMLSATEKELCEVAGIGKTLARGIRQALRELRPVKVD